MIQIIGVIKFEIKLFNRKKKKRFRSLIVKNVLTAQGLNISLKKLNLHKSWTMIGTQLRRNHRVKFDWLRLHRLSTISYVS